MSHAYQGLVTSQTGILIPRMKEGFLATAGFPKTNASGSLECMQLPLRAEKSSFNWTMLKQMDVSTSANMTWYQLAGNMIYVYSGVEFLKNIMLLSQGPCQGFFADLNGHMYNFVEEAGTYAVPTGTDLLSVGFKYTISQMKQAQMELTLKTTLTDNEYLLLNDSTFNASYQTGGSGGTPNGLVAMAALTGAARAGFKTITVNGVSIGEIHPDTELTIESGSTPVPGNKGREYARMAKVTLKAVSSQMSPTNVQGAIDHSQNPDYQVVATDYMGNAWTFVTGMKPEIMPKHGDEVGTLEVNMYTEYPYDFSNAIDFSTLATPTFTQLGLY